MRIAVTGSSGLIGSALRAALREAGHDVWPVVREASSSGPLDIPWPDDSSAGLSRWDGVDAVVHLAGENIASGRWTSEKKRRILGSRAGLTERLCRALLDMPRPPKVVVSASAVGYYGDRGDEVLTEDSAGGSWAMTASGELPRASAFLALVCARWESAFADLAARGIRVVTPRFGVVLSMRGGALPRMALPFRLGAGGRAGDGRQYMSWIALDDAVRAIQFAIEQEILRGPVNAVAPGPVTNAEFTRVLARVMRRPAWFPVPAFILRIVLGEMADALLLSSARVIPRKLLDAGFEFRHPGLEPALRHVLGRNAAERVSG